MVSIKDDLFEAVNAEWLANTEIPSDRPRIAAFDELVIANEKTLMDDFNGGDFDTEGDKVLENFAKFYRKAGDFEARANFGIEPVKKELERITSIPDFDSYKAQLTDLILTSQAPVPFSLEVSADMKDAIHHALYFTGPELILPDTTYYADEHPRKEELLKVWSDNTTDILKDFGYSDDDAAALVKDTLAFDASLVPLKNTSEENAKYAQLYNPIAFSDFVEHIQSVDMAAVIEGLIGTQPKEVIVFENRFYDGFDSVINEQTWPLIKAWSTVRLIRASTGLLSDELRIKGTVFGRAVSGIPEARAQEKHAFDLATGSFSQAVGLYYGQKHFGEAAKADVKRMIAAMIKVYQERLANNDWLSQQTIDKAIEKLDALTPMVGFPDALPEVYNELIVGDGSIYEDAAGFGVARTKAHYAKFVKDVDRSEWHMPAHMVNAYFSSDSNTIVFPAAILQAPFYSVNQSSSQNYGGIGAVIAHEISHAFDNNGANFDKYGNLSKWWLDEDFKAFEAKQEEMIREFDGIELAGAKVNGKLVVSENIADQGGITAALQAAKKEADYDAVAFFSQWAEIWRIKASQEYMQMLLSVDVHAPGKLRANVQATNLDDFFDTFGVVEGDGMWRAPEDRVKIW